MTLANETIGDIGSVRSGSALQVHQWRLLELLQVGNSARPSALHSSCTLAAAPVAGNCTATAAREGERDQGETPCVAARRRRSSESPTQGEAVHEALVLDDFAMEELRFYEEGNYYNQGLKLHEDESYFQFQDFSANHLLGEDTMFSAQHFCAISCPESSFSRDELGCLSEVDFDSFWAQVEEENARCKNKEGYCEKALINLEAGIGSVPKSPQMRGSWGSSSSGKKALTFELVSRHFCMPIKQAARELNVGVTILKKRCRELGITRWPHRKVKSLQMLIDNVQELGKQTAHEDGRLTRRMVEVLQRMEKLIEERPEMMLDEETNELRQLCFNYAHEDGHLTRSTVEVLQWMKKLIEERPEMMLDEKTKELRQLCFKETFKRRRHTGHDAW